MTAAMSSQRDDALDNTHGIPAVHSAGEESSLMTSVRTGEGFPYEDGVHAELFSQCQNQTQSKGDAFNMTTVKDLKVIAKELGLKGYSAMNKETLANAIAAAVKAAELPSEDDYRWVCDGCGNDYGTREKLGDQYLCVSCFGEASEPKASEHPLVIADQSDDDFFSGDDEDTEEEPIVVHVGRMEFVKGTNLAVQFKWEGKHVIIGWSKTDYKMHSWSEATGRSMITSYATQMKFFKKLKNGLDGDVAQTVKALVRIKAMPAEIKVLQRKTSRSEDQNVSGRRVDENVRIRRGVVDVNVMNVFVGMYAEAFDMSEADVRKKGMLIREFMNQYATLNDETSVEEYVANYIGDLYYAANVSE